jgi:hypothetical protein
LDLDHCGHFAKPIGELESNCKLLAAGNQGGVARHPDPPLADESACKGLEVLSEHCKRNFVERVDWKRPNVSYVKRYERYMYQRSRRESVSQVAQDEGLSKEATQAIFEHIYSSSKQPERRRDE